MILESAIINLTRNLDILNQKDGKGISSHDKLKEEGLSCLGALIDKAPISEYNNLINSENYEILLGYLINVLCQLAKNDKSKSVRSQSLLILSTLINRLEDLHDSFKHDGCSISLFAKALPGITSTLFRIIMSDTRLPRNIMTMSIEILAKVITVAFRQCDHKKDETSILSPQNLDETCDNLAIRLSYLFDYVTSRSNDLSDEVKFTMLKLCHGIVCRTKDELLKRTLKSIVKYSAFVSSLNDLRPEVQLELMIITDNIQDRIRNCDTCGDRLDSVVISSLFDLLENLDNHCMSMLFGERMSEISVLCGLLKLLPEESLTTFLEVNEKRTIFFRVLSKLCEFSTDQPFLFLTGTEVGDEALETTQRIYTVEKRFSHISEKELNLITICCQIIGQNTDWFSLNDMIKCDLGQFSDATNLFLTNLVLKGCLKRQIDSKSRVTRFTQRLIEFYLDNTSEQYIDLSETSTQEGPTYSSDIIKVVIAIESLVTILELHIKFSETEAERTIILRPLLCPLLNWSSSTSRAISEASLSVLTQISQLYELDSIKSLIEANIDYIVDGVSHMLENFSHNHEVTNVLATTFKLSSMTSFCYFKDIYERVFQLLRAYHHTEKAKSIVLLFYRTLSILDDWRKARNESNLDEEPLKSESSLKSIIFDLDISHRLNKLNEDMVENQRFKQRLEAMQSTELDMEHEFLESCQSNKTPRKDDVDEEETHAENREDEAKTDRPPDIVLTETIMKHCIGLISSNHNDIKILALRTAACGFRILRDDENTLLPLVHQLWSPLVSRLTSDYKQNLEINLCAFECLVSMAECAKDFMRARTLETIIPRLCLFLETQARESKGKKDYGPYCMTLVYKCQLRILESLGALAYHIQLAYSSLWRVVKATLIYLDHSQVSSLRESARASLHYMIALDADCVWFYAKKSGHLKELPFELIYEVEVR